MANQKIENLCYWAVTSFISKTCAGCIITREDDCPIKQYVRYGDHQKEMFPMRTAEPMRPYEEKK